VTFPNNPQFPKPGPAPGGFRPGPTPGGFRPGPPPPPQTYAAPAAPNRDQAAPHSGPVASDGGPGSGEVVTETGHPAVDAVLRSLENASRLAPGAQIAEYEAAHQVLQETLASIDG
jgi:hypothetical protein